MRRCFNMEAGGSFLLRDWQWQLIENAVRAGRLPPGLLEWVDCQGDLCLEDSDFCEVTDFLREQHL